MRRLRTRSRYPIFVLILGALWLLSPQALAQNTEAPQSVIKASEGLPQMAWGYSVSGLRLGIGAGSAIFSPDQPVKLSFVIENAGQSSINIKRIGWLNDYTVTVTTEGGTKVPRKNQSGGVDIYHEPTFSVPPGSEYVYRLNDLKQWFELVPGTYVVSAATEVYSAPSQAQASERVATLLSGTVTIRVE